MKGFALLLIAAATALVSSETDPKAEKPAQNVEEAESLPSLYSLLAEPMFRNGFDQFKNQHGHDSHDGHNGHIMAKPYAALSIFKTELLPHLMFFGLVGTALYVIVALVKNFFVSKLLPLLPVSAISRRKREIDSQIDDLASTVFEAIYKQQCLERACCEIGYHSRQLQISKRVLPVLTKVTSKPMLQAFQTGVIGKRYCEKYSCRVISS